MVPGSLGCGVSVLPIAAMFAPSRAALSAMARPIPRLAPVMKRVLDARGVAIRRIIVAGLSRKKGARRKASGLVRPVASAPAAGAARRCDHPRARHGGDSGVRALDEAPDNAGARSCRDR